MSSGDPSARRLRVIERVLHLADDRLVELEQFLDTPIAAAPKPPTPALSRDWPHAPLHRISKQGTHIVTAGTYQKQHLFAGADRLDRLETALFRAAKEAGWHLEAWAVFSNHYHFVAHAQPDCLALAVWLAKLHYETAGAINALDQCAGRMVALRCGHPKKAAATAALQKTVSLRCDDAKSGVVAASTGRGTFPQAQRPLARNWRFPCRSTCHAKPTGHLSSAESPSPTDPIDSRRGG